MFTIFFFTKFCEVLLTEGDHISVQHVIWLPNLLQNQCLKNIDPFRWIKMKRGLLFGIFPISATSLSSAETIRQRKLGQMMIWTVQMIHNSIVWFILIWLFWVCQFNIFAHLMPFYLLAVIDLIENFWGTCRVQSRRNLFRGKGLYQGAGQKWPCI